ncbi:DUF4148 domain-containing protein [Herminiimonas arsenitoxidans]|uniref:DUF4148 domain-containing protein n=1 Tax=Herminiimonas arsenitoxidans TaxID=1809410 RepID=UPI0009706FF5|nr:DUF4148 domain-containing protein [Herminiimonas arsenitoxidans]
MKSITQKTIFALTLSVASAAVFSQSAFAGESNYPVLTQTGPAKTKAQVQAELREARANGQMDVPDSAYPILAPSKSTKTRDQVKAELKQAQTSEELQKFERKYGG